MIDLRSDTVTKPTRAMRAAMAAADVGDDVYGEDPTVNRLEEFAADLLGTESAIFCTSGTQSNLLALLGHCARGDEFIVGKRAHSYKYEGGGAASLGSIHPFPLEFEPDGTLDLDSVSAAVRPENVHFPRTTLVCLENTQDGRALPLDYLNAAKRLTDELDLRMHLDGARIFNAAVKLGVPVRDICRHFDSTSFCLSKGLGAPVGSLLCGSENLIREARRWRKTLGGGMRQAGIIAAAGLYALKNNVARLADDHENAKSLARCLNELDELDVQYSESQTNMAFVDLGRIDSGELTEFLAERAIVINRNGTVRLVTHLDISESDVERVVAAFKAYLAP
ncbi:MAG: low-specificity L-threonine aldolase [Rhodospirillaceae bacterium]|nr:low-specificity L-threonine aldolase [Rhodospirillaceae bacterium]